MLTRRHAVAGLASLTLADRIPAALAQQPRLLPYYPLSAPLFLIALPAFVADAAADDEIAAGITQIVNSNLRRSGLFAPRDPATFIEHITSFDTVPEFASWKSIRAEALLTGKVAHQDDGRLKVQFRLWNTAAGQQVAGQQYVTSPDYWRRIAHIISDQIYTQMTGEKGYFDSRIAFVEESDAAEGRVRRLALMDQDGANLRYLTRGTRWIGAPSFSLRDQTIAFLQMGEGDPQLFLFDIESGRREHIDGLPGAPLSAPRFSPDGKRLVITLVQGGNANLFAVELATRSVTRLTDGAAIDTSPSYSPDGSQLCFESDRAGRPQIYVMPANGGRAQRISFGDGAYSTPVWSPCDDTIAFIKQAGGESAIGVVKPDGSAERILAAGFRDTGFHIDGPAFAPNGRVLMFSRNSFGNTGPSLFTIDVSGRNELKQPTPRYASDPAWSPLLS